MYTTIVSIIIVEDIIGENTLPTIAALKDMYTPSQIIDELDEYEGLYYTKSGQLVIPEEARIRIVSCSHLGLTGGHQGINRNTKRILKNFWWPNAKRDVTESISSCIVCARRRHKSK